MKMTLSATPPAVVAAGQIAYLSTLLVVAALWLGVTAVQRVWLQRQAQYATRLRPGRTDKCSALLAALLLGSHAALLNIALVFKPAQYGTDVAMHAILVAFWSINLGLLLAASPLRRRRGLLVLWSFAAVWYAWQLLACVSTYLELEASTSGSGPQADSKQRRLALVRMVILSIDLALLFCATVSQIAGKPGSTPDEEEPLLAGSADTESGMSKEGRRWQLVYGTFRYLWPDSTYLKLRLVLCFVLIALGRVINLAVPVLYKHVVDRLSEVSNLTHQPAPASGSGDNAGAGGALGGLTDLGAGGGGNVAACLRLLAAASFTFGEVFMPWVALYLLFYFLQGGSSGESVGLIANLRQYLWIPITQRAYRRVSMDVFGHLLDLDLNFHLHRKTGQIMRILDRGTTSIQNILSVVIFNVVPQIVDIVAACVYMASALEAWVAIIVFVTISSYIPITVLITEWRGKIRKRMNALDNAKEARATDMLLNYETVKYFCSERRELDFFGRSIDRYQAQEFLQMAAINMLNVVQSFTIFLGLAAGLAICVAGIARGTLTVGDTVLFLTMMNQLYAPLNFFGSYYRQVQKGLIDMENMFELMNTVPRVSDAPAARALVVSAGAVDFEQVTFGYLVGTPVLRNVSFHVPGGHTVAVVGATGSGKSTILRLLLRFYDPWSGRVCVDGQNIAQVTQASLRGAIAVVPQDTVLFNDTIQFNIAYGRPGAGRAEVEHAAQVAHIHGAIQDRFPAGYDTLVGERGLRLSGGEKQRVAFARAVLKAPAILVLDEATSALDSLTEKMIQSSLLEMRSRCTTFIVAHRLSTIMDADTILVFEAGQVAEAGSHGELIARRGLYAAMWARQQETTASHLDLLALVHHKPQLAHAAPPNGTAAASADDGAPDSADGGSPDSATLAGAAAAEHAGGAAGEASDSDHSGGAGSRELGTGRGGTGGARASPAANGGGAGGLARHRPPPRRDSSRSSLRGRLLGGEEDDDDVSVVSERDP